VAGPRLSGLAGGVRRLDTSPRWSRCARDPAEVGGLDRYAHRRRSRPRGAGRCQLRVRCSSIPCLRSLPVVSVKGPRPRTPTPRARASTAVCPAGASPYAPPFRRLPKRAPKQLRPGVVCRDCASFRHASRICETCVAPNGESCERTNTCGLGAPAHRPFARNRRGCRWVFRSSLTSTRNTWPVIGNPVSGLFFWRRSRGRGEKLCHARVPPMPWLRLALRSRAHQAPVHRSTRQRDLAATPLPLPVDGLRVGRQPTRRARSPSQWAFAVTGDSLRASLPVQMHRRLGGRIEAASPGYCGR
jgi:hypothetical protein